ncbi:polysaccharide export protein [Caulobacter sp. 17J65-9]|nr:polysaccharide export protein [Caulobacter sp. 17J65-9]
MDHARTNRRLMLAALAGLALAGCATSRSAARFPDIDFATWTDDEPGYRLYPGDEIEVATPTAPELTRTVKVGPDGRVALPLIGDVMAADRSLPDLQTDISKAYSSQLLRPVVEVSLKTAGLKVFVGGEVTSPGAIDMPGDIDALQAVIMAGGFKPGAKTSEVVLIRRGPGGRAMARTIDLSKALKDPSRADRAALRRFDIVYVPRTAAAEAGVYMAQVRDMMPIGFSYSLNNPYGR